MKADSINPGNSGVVDAIAGLSVPVALAVVRSGVFLPYTFACEDVVRNQAHLEDGSTGVMAQLDLWCCGLVVGFRIGLVLEALRFHFQRVFRKKCRLQRKAGKTENDLLLIIIIVVVPLKAPIGVCTTLLRGQQPFSIITTKYAC